MLEKSIVEKYWGRVLERSGGETFFSGWKEKGAGVWVREGTAKHIFVKNLLFQKKPYRLWLYFHFIASLLASSCVSLVPSCQIARFTWKERVFSNSWLHLRSLLKLLKEDGYHDCFGLELSCRFVLRPLKNDHNHQDKGSNAAWICWFFVVISRCPSNLFAFAQCSLKFCYIMFIYLIPNFQCNWEGAWTHHFDQTVEFAHVFQEVCVRNKDSIVARTSYGCSLCAESFAFRWWCCVDHCTQTRLGS